MKETAIFKLGNLADRKPEYAIVGDVDLVVVRFDEEISVFYGRCLHRRGSAQARLPHLRCDPFFP